MKKKSGSVEINDLIFKELIKRGYSLDGNTRVWNIADSKLWYLTPEQAQGYLDLDADISYKKATGQQQAEDLVKKNINDILENINGEPINIVDLGCGDGIKAALMVEEIKRLKPEIKIRYCPIDISGYMVEKAMETFKHLDVDEVIEFQYNISDFENLENIAPLLRKDEYKKNFFLLLGNTLGNFEVNELLYEIKNAMKEGDLFLVDTAIDDNKQEERVESYKQNQKFNDFLSYIPLQLGLTKKDIDWGAKWINSRIEFYYTIKNDKIINFQNKILHFNKGDQIITAIAYKHAKDDLLAYLHMYFSKVVVKISMDKSKILVICER